MSLLCTTCKEVFKSTDDIYATNCGHIFHFVCMNEFQSRSTSCPACGHYKPTTYKMFLLFEKSENANLIDSVDKLKILELHEEVENNKNNYLHLQEKYGISQGTVRKLEEKIRKADYCLTQKICTLSEFEDRIQTLEELNTFLAMDNNCKEEALSLRSKEIAKMKHDLEGNKNAAATVKVLRNEIKDLKQKLKYETTKHLEQQKKNCTKHAKDTRETQKYRAVKESGTNISKEALITPIGNLNMNDVETEIMPANIYEIKNITDNISTDLTGYKLVSENEHVFEGIAQAPTVMYLTSKDFLVICVQFSCLFVIICLLSNATNIFF